MAERGSGALLDRRPHSSAPTTEPGCLVLPKYCQPDRSSGALLPDTSHLMALVLGMAENLEINWGVAEKTQKGFNVETQHNELVAEPELSN